jgi:hypothetical protein
MFTALLLLAPNLPVAVDPCAIAGSFSGVVPVL